MLKKLLKKIFGDSEEKTRKEYQHFVDAINAQETDYEQLSEGELREKTDVFRQRLGAGESLDDLLVEAFAAVREASKRTTGLRHYDVQLIGGVVLHQGKIAEMKTGEGKTLVATLPLYLNALAGKGTHLVTVNDYLARRDAGWMGPIYHLLGMRVGFIGHEYSALFDPDYVDPTGTLDDERLVHWRPCTRREAYEADITYGTNNEFGFDYLRDNMVHSFESLVQRGHFYAIVDEVDNILIDEARTPLIISGPASQSSSQYARFAQLVRNLRAGRVSPDEVKKGAEPDGDVLIDPKSRSVVLTEAGLAKVESQVEELQEGESIYDPQHSDLTHYMENALKAKFIYYRDKDYVVQQGEVIIVDEFTGRLMPGRRWSDGLHQAVEAKEGVDVRRESVTYATITFQNYFRMYEKLAGMTGTAATEKEEFFKIYHLDVAVIPTNRPCVREDLPDQIYRSEEAKFNAVLRDIRERTVHGQPVLVGTTAVETSERLSLHLKRELNELLKGGTIHLHVLNAKQNADEAAIVAQAGQPGTITIATNMAGRGTDILLGGNPEALASRHLRDKGLDRKQLEELTQALFGDKKVQRLSPEAIIERSGGKLGDDIVAALTELHQHFEEGVAQIEQKGEHLFLVDTLLHDAPAHMYEQKRELVRAALQGNHARARRLVRDLGVSEEKIVEIAHTHRDYTFYRNNRRDRPNFLAGKLFDRIYTARAKLVQVTIRGDRAQAEEIVQTVPGLKESYIDDILTIQRTCQENHAFIRQIGGLHVIGTERHEARRIDNQLRGRSGRQGDAGSSRFYLSLEDELMHRFGRMDTLKGAMEKLGVEDDVPIEAGIINKSIEGAQSRVEGFNFDIRKHTVDYDDVMNKQREVIYARRRKILEEADEQQRLETLLDRSFRSDQLFQEIRDELHISISLPAELAQERLARLLPDVSFDIARLRMAGDDALVAMLLPLITEQQQRAMPVLVDELSDIIDMPDDAVEVLRQSSYEEAKTYVHNLWHEQGEGDLEERIKDLFDAEFGHLVERYLVNYESWLSDQIAENVTEATNPSTDEVNIVLVQRRLKTVLPEIDSLDIADLARLDPDRLQRQLESLIPASMDEGHHIRLLLEEILSLVPIFPSPQEMIWQQLSPVQREQERERYIERYIQVLTIITVDLPAEEQQRLAQEATEFVHQQVKPLFNPTVRVSQDERAKMYTAILIYGKETLYGVLEQLEPDQVQGVLADLLDLAFDRWRDGIGERQLTGYQRILMLQTIDREWQNYLTAMEDLRQGIGLQAIGQRDPLVQYQTAGYRMFSELLDNIDRTVVHSFFPQLPNYQRHVEQYRAEIVRQEQAAKAGLEIVAGTAAGAKASTRRVSQTVRREAPKVGPNDLCPCGSGRKYKHCHGRPVSGTSATERGREGELLAVANEETPGGAGATPSSLPMKKRKKKR